MWASEVRGNPGAVLEALTGPQSSFPLFASGPNERFVHWHNVKGGKNRISGDLRWSREKVLPALDSWLLTFSWLGPPNTTDLVT